MISALIFSMNRIENVVRLAEKIRPYVDEIVIVDSSNKKNCIQNFIFKNFEYVYKKAQLRET